MVWGIQKTFPLQLQATIPQHWNPSDKLSQIKEEKKLCSHRHIRGTQQTAVPLKIL